MSSVKPGWGLPIKGIEVRCLSAAGDHITKPLAGSGRSESVLQGAEPAEADGRYGERPFRRAF